MARQAPARRYAQAVFELAITAGKVDEWRRDLGRVCELAGDARLARAIDNPAAPLAYRRKVVEELLGGRVAPQVLNLALLLTSRSRFWIAPAVGDEYDDLVRHSSGIVAATVITPMPLSDAELAELRPRIESRAGARVEISTEIDPSLIGGLCVRIGGLEIDASLRGRLERLRAELVRGTS